MYDLVNFNIQNLSSHISESQFQHLTFPTQLWESFNSEIKDFLHTKTWLETRYLDENNNFDCKVNNISELTGGIYCFYINSEILPNQGHMILCYIGRAHIPPANNLQKRIKQYRNYELFPEEYERPRLRKLFGNWGKYIYCRYLEISNEVLAGLSGNNLIDMIEEELINKLLPPCNSRVPNITIANAAERAFA